MAEKCKYHPEKSIAAYCLNCTQFLCMECMLSHKKDQNSHKIMTMIDLTTTVIEKIKLKAENIGSLDSVMQEMKDLSKICEEKTEMMKIFYEKMKNECIKVIDGSISKQMKKLQIINNQVETEKSKLSVLEKQVKDLKINTDKVSELFENHKYSSIIEKYNDLINPERQENKINKQEIEFIKAKIYKISMPNFDTSDLENDIDKLFEKYGEFLNLPCALCQTKLEKISHLCSNCKKSVCKNCSRKCPNCHKLICIKCEILKSDENTNEKMTNCHICEKSGCFLCLKCCEKCQSILCEQCITSKEKCCLSCKMIIIQEKPFTWTNGSNIISHKGLNWKNYFSTNKCPEYFTATIKIKKYESSDMGGLFFGVAKCIRELTSIDYLGAKDDEWAMNGNSYVLNNNKMVNYGKKFDKDSVIKIIHSKDNSLSFFINTLESVCQFRDTANLERHLT